CVPLRPGHAEPSGAHACHRHAVDPDHDVYSQSHQQPVGGDSPDRLGQADSGESTALAQQRRREHHGVYCGNSCESSACHDCVCDLEDHVDDECRLSYVGIDAGTHIPVSHSDVDHEPFTRDL